MIGFNMKENKIKSRLLLPCLSTLSVLLMSCHSGSTQVGAGGGLGNNNSDGNYQGSQAYANSLFVGENVNEQTGTLTLGQNLINTKGVSDDVNLSLNLLYSSSSSGNHGVFGLPKGWSYDLAFVIPGKTLTIGGSTFLIDEKWEDINGYRSGLRYVNNNGVKFEHSIGVLSGKLDKRRYDYVYQDVQGGHLYFDTDGKPLAQADRFGNMISYYYRSSGDVYNSLLTSIVDSYGNSYEIQTGSTMVRITQAKRSVASFEFGDDGVSSFVNAAGEKTIYSYNIDGLMTSIRYPSGITSNISYSILNYKNCTDGKVKSLPAVSVVNHRGTDVSDSTQYDYGSGNNFTGYPNVCMGMDSDKLADSMSSGFSYGVLVSKKSGSNVLSATRTYYNYLSLPISQDVLSGGQVLSSKNFKYNIPEKTYLRPASYASPVEETQLVGGSIISKVENNYNKYGEVINSKRFISSNGSLVAASEDETQYDDKFYYLPVKTVHKDLLGGTTQVVNNTLSKDMPVIEQSNKTYNGMPSDKTNATYTNEGLPTYVRLNSPSVSGLGSVSSVSLKYNYEINSGNELINKIDAKGGVKKVLTSTVLPGNPTLEETTPGGHKRTYTYDSMGRVLTETDLNGNSVSYKYTIGTTNTVTKSYPNGYVVVEAYDGMGRLIKTTDSLGHTLGTKSYDGMGRIISETDRRGNVAVYGYDALGRKIKTVDSLGNVITDSYSEDGLTVTSSMNGKKMSEVRHNGAGAEIYRAEYGVDGSAKTITKTVDSAGNVLHEIVTNGSITVSDTTNQYNDLNKVIYSKIKLSDGTSVERTSQYDIYGNVILTKTTISGKGSYSSDTQKFDELGRMIEQVNAAGKKKSFSYDADGKLISFTDIDGSVTSYTYDANGNELSASKGGITISKTYDKMNNRTSISDGTHTISYSYDQMGNLLSEKYPDGKTVSYEYDSYGTLIKKVNAYGISTNYTVDKIGRITNIASGSSSMSYAYTNEPFFGEFLLKSSNFSGDGTNLSHDYSYDGWGKLIADKVNQNGNNIDTLYNYDLLDRVTSQKTSSSLANSELNVENRYSYNGLNQLLSSTTTTAGKVLTDSYSYDVKSNILSHVGVSGSTTYTYNSMDQLTSVNGKSIKYDNAGNMTVDDEGNIYNYDGLNRLVSVTKGGKLLSSYSYYPDSLLSRKEGSNEEQHFYYDNGNVDALVTNGIVSNYMLDGSGKPLSRMKGEDVSALLSALRSTIGTISKGQVSNSYSYDAYGQKMSQNNKEEKEYLGWNQEYMDDKTGLVFLRARFYNPRLMRFMNIDTYNVMNRYAYTEGDPINKIDPSGHMSALGWLDIGVTVIGTIATGGSYAIAAAGRIAAIKMAKVGLKAGLKAMIRPTTKGFVSSLGSAAIRNPEATVSGFEKAIKAVTIANRVGIVTDLTALGASAYSLGKNAGTGDLHWYNIADFANIGLISGKWIRRAFLLREQRLIRNQRLSYSTTNYDDQFKHNLRLLEVDANRVIRDSNNEALRLFGKPNPYDIRQSFSETGSLLSSSSSSSLFSNRFDSVGDSVIGSYVAGGMYNY